MSSDEREDDVYNPKSHKKLLQAISSLGKAQHIRKTTRNEPQQQQSEFQLLKAGSGDVVLKHGGSDARLPVGIHDIVQVLRSTQKHLDTGKQLKKIQSAKKILEKPLEKPAAERIKRSIGYENVKKKLERWDAVVSKNRSAETQVFPLKTETIYVNTAANSKPLQLSLKSELRLEMEATDAKLKALKKERIGDFDDEDELMQKEKQLLKKKLTRDELIERRRELAYLKMRESQKSVKARMQNKIKSKKYHKLMKRQKLQEQIKQFELLQKTNPEAALEKLNALEKVRVLERASLRHRNTGAWAQNLQIRAKYDKDVRKDLAEQLQISRQLTEKKTNPDDDAESGGDDDNGKRLLNAMDVDNDDEAANDPFNPWTRVGSNVKSNGKEANKETKDENWRKYWLERNASDKLLDEYRKGMINDVKAEERGEENEVDGDNVEDKKRIKDVKNMEEVVDDDRVDEDDNDDDYVGEDEYMEIMNGLKQKIVDKIEKSKQSKNHTQKGDVDKVEEKPIKSTTKLQQKTPQNTKTSKKQKSTKKIIENGWVVEEIKPMKPSSVPAEIEKNIDDIFDAKEDKIKRSLNRQMKKLAKQAKLLKKSQNNPKNKKKKTKKQAEKDELKNLKDLSFKNEITRPIIDEELNHEDVEVNELNETILKANTTTATASDISRDTTQNSAITNGDARENRRINQNTDPLAATTTTTSTIDPNKLATIKIKQPHLHAFTAINETIGDDLGDIDVDALDSEEARLHEQQMTISQAFEDDDIIADFSQDKRKESELKNLEIELTMPGWGSWAGAGISKEQQQKRQANSVANKNKRLLLKLAKEEKRRDENKDGIYINETASKQLRTHLVSDIPFPFKSLQDYEASIRAPIGRNFVPETAFRMLTRPAVITHKGQVIEPMDESELVKRDRRPRGIVDRRIKRAAAVAAASVAIAAK